MLELERKVCISVRFVYILSDFNTVKTPVLKLTPAGVNTGPISNGVNLTPFWCYFNTLWCFSSPVGVISTPKSVEITPKCC